MRQEWVSDSNSRGAFRGNSDASGTTPRGTKAVSLGNGNCKMGHILCRAYGSRNPLRRRPHRSIGRGHEPGRMLYPLRGLGLAPEPLSRPMLRRSTALRPTPGVMHVQSVTHGVSCPARRSSGPGSPQQRFRARSLFRSSVVWVAPTMSPPTSSMKSSAARSTLCPAPTT